MKLTAEEAIRSLDSIVKNAETRSELADVSEDVMAILNEGAPAEFVTENGKKCFDLATAPIVDDDRIPQTLREAIISREGHSIEVTTFLRKFGEQYVQSCLDALPHRDRMTQHTDYLDANTTYRALRHLLS